MCHYTTCSVMEKSLVNMINNAYTYYLFQVNSKYWSKWSYRAFTASSEYWPECESSIMYTICIIFVNITFDWLRTRSIMCTFAIIFVNITFDWLWISSIMWKFSNIFVNITFDSLRTRSIMCSFSIFCQYHLWLTMNK
jgi:hypothetical protein